MRRRLQTLTACCVLLAGLDVLAAPITAQHCPPGSTLRTSVDKKQNARTRFCMDSKGRMQGRFQLFNLAWGSLEGEMTYVDGVKHGPMKTFDRQGRLLITADYEHGEMTRSEFSDDGLRELCDSENKKLIAAGSVLRMRLDPHRRMVYELHSDLSETAPPPGLSSLGLPAELKSMVCELFLLHNLTGADVELYNRANRLVEKREINPSECQAFGNATRP